MVERTSQESTLGVVIRVEFLFFHLVLEGVLQKQDFRSDLIQPLMASCFLLDQVQFFLLICEPVLQCLTNLDSHSSSLDSVRFMYCFLLLCSTKLAREPRVGVYVKIFYTCQSPTPCQMHHFIKISKAHLLILISICVSVQIHSFKL